MEIILQYLDVLKCNFICNENIIIYIISMFLFLQTGKEDCWRYRIWDCLCVRFPHSTRKWGFFDHIQDWLSLREGPRVKQYQRRIGCLALKLLDWFLHRSNEIVSPFSLYPLKPKARHCMVSRLRFLYHRKKRKDTASPIFDSNGLIVLPKTVLNVPPAAETWMCGKPQEIRYGRWRLQKILKKH